MNNLDIEFAIARIAKQFSVSPKAAARVYLDFVKHKKQELEQQLQEQFGEKTVSQLRFLAFKKPTIQDLIFTYHRLKANDELALAELTEDWIICVESRDAIGSKLFPAGTSCEVVKSWLGGSILEIWLGEDCCTYIESKVIKLV